MYLHFQSLQLRLCKLRGELRGFSLSFAQASVIVGCVSDDECRPIDHQTHMKIINTEESVLEEGKQCRRISKVWITEVPVSRCSDGQNREGENNTEGGVNKQIAKCVAPQFEAFRQHEYQWRNRSPEIEVHEIPGQGCFPKDRGIALDS